MKTYSLFAAVGITTVCAASVRADSYNISLIGGGSWNFVANELDFATGNYISNVFHFLPAEDSILKFNAARQQFYTPQPSDTLNPGEGALIMHLGFYPTFSFTGTPPSAQSPLTLLSGLYQLVGLPSKARHCWSGILHYRTTPTILTTAADGADLTVRRQHLRLRGALRYSSFCSRP